jgi:hypothetical protein
MNPWRFLEYVTSGGRNPLRDWYLSQDDAVRSALDFTIHQLRVTDDWLEPKRKSSKRQFSPLVNEHAGLGELRFWPDDGRKFRVPGIYRPNEREFIMFAGCEKRFGGLIQIPNDAFDVALKLKKEFEAGHGGVIVHV